MKKNNRIYLADILDCIEQIEIYTKGFDWNSFKTDMKTRDAVLRNLEVLGEAATRLSDSFKEKYPRLELYKAIGMRNQLIHGYDKIKFRTVWQTIKKDLPKLKRKI